MNRIPKQTLVFLWISLTISLTISTQTFSQGKFVEDFKELDDVIAKHVAENNISGLAYCVVKDKQMIWSGAAGWANIEEKIPMSIDGIMNIASISKTFTATAIMQLWEKGLLDLEADVSEHLPSQVRNPKHPDVPITIYQLLTHTSSPAERIMTQLRTSINGPLAIKALTPMWDLDSWDILWSR